MSAWLKLVLLGLLSIALGAFVLGNVVLASLAVTTLTGALLLVTGGIQVVTGFTVAGWQHKALALLLGLALAFLGWAFLSNPLEGMISLTSLIMILVGASGLVRLYVSMNLRGTAFFVPMLLSGIVSLALALYIFFNFAAATMSLLGILLGVELLSNGVSLLVLGYAARKARSA
ncbi:MAG: DUF308 domain-containing protein [Rhodobacter sp.]|uniref:HdeD family acid-resistance protein n=1 Tax=Pararhodobacter sp. TaxID=2127056 RepID=UPI001D73FA60|nr:DUF308 domain-containing protein [Pararhodobacter sp.]MCB1343751.1 DUF308 domain-containing protein [Paracoccaceae bacterium]MCC0072738.1 DUF308 domain-containing protein [Rhodobacter sp.]HPD90983.1 DUF308 domain-containing protein [Pararhodobacter sp.]